MKEQRFKELKNNSLKILYNDIEILHNKYLVDEFLNEKERIIILSYLNVIKQTIKNNHEA